MILFIMNQENEDRKTRLTGHRPDLFVLNFFLHNPHIHVSTRPGNLFLNNQG